MTVAMNKTRQPAGRKKPAPDGPSQTILRQTFAMTNPNGMHARPCALLAKTLRPFGCEARVEANGSIASGKSILGLMALAAGFGSKLTFSINGSDATQAMAAVHRLFETQFEEAYAPENKVIVA